MKRVTESVHITLPPVRLFREDIEDVIGSWGDSQRLEFVHRDYSYESLDELADRAPNSLVHDLKILAWRPGPNSGMISVDFEPGGVSLYAGHENAATASLIAEKLRRRVPWYSWRPVGHWWLGLRAVLGLLLAWSLALFLASFLPFTTSARLAIAVVAGGGIGFAAFADRVWLGATVLHLDPRARQITFWQRNRDKILVGVITSVLSGIGGYLLGKLLP